MRKADLIKPKYTGILQTFALVSREEGPLALWKGNGANGASSRAWRRDSSARQRVAPPPHRTHPPPPMPLQCCA